MRILLFVLMVIKVISTQSICNLNIAQNKMAAFSGKDIIYNKGEINEQWKEDSVSSYKSPMSSDIEYFYTLEIHDQSVPSLHQQIKAEVSTSTPNIVKPTVTIYPTEQTSPTIQTVTIEVKYNCIEGVKDVAKISMTITADRCDPFTLYWTKVCKDKNHFPNVNLGITPKGTEIIKEGKKTDVLKVLDQAEESKLILNKDINDFDLFITSTKQGKNLILREPKLIYDTNSMTGFITGSLQKGGIITNDASTIHLRFECALLKETTTDLELVLEFENNDIISIFFKKDCLNVGVAQDYFNVFYKLYWVFLILITCFILYSVTQYMKRNDITLGDIYLKVTTQYKRWLNQNKKEKQDDEMLTNPNVNLYEETDLVDVKIKTDTKSINNQERKFSNFSSDYGGI